MRRGFLLNASVLVLLIPILLLAATYENVSSYIVQSQSERVQIERTSDVVDFLNLGFQQALEISGKRAVVTAVDYVTTTGDFIQNYSNNTIAHLILSGESGDLGNYNPSKIMKGQTIIEWLGNISSILLKQGYALTYNPSNIEIKVAPLDAFHIVIEGRVTNVTLKDLSGKVVYNGQIPSRGGYAYSVVDIAGIEDPLFPPTTGGRYHRSITACPYSYPERDLVPVLNVSGLGISSSRYVVGRYGSTLDDYLTSTVLNYNRTDVWDDSGDSISNLTIGRFAVTTSSLIEHERDMGVLFFPAVSPGGNSWCAPSMEHRVNLTLPSSVPLNSLVLLEFSSTAPFANAAHKGNRASIVIYKRSSTCDKAPYWIEYWGDDKILIWLNTTNARNYTIYYSSNPAFESDGDINIFPFHIENLALSAGIRKELELFNVSWSSVYIRYQLKSNTPSDFDGGIGVNFTTTKPCMMFIKAIHEGYGETRNVQVPIYLSAKNITNLGANWTTNRAAITIRDANGNIVPFWIEYWNSNGALIWVKSDLMEYQEGSPIPEWLQRFLNIIPFGDIIERIIENIIDFFFGGGSNVVYYNVFTICPSDDQPTRGEGDEVFKFFDDFNASSLNMSKWKVGGSQSYISLSNGVLTLNGDSDPSTSDVWLWTNKTFPYYSYVVGMGVKVSSSADQGWLWYINSNKVGWMEDVLYDSYYDSVYGHLYDFNVNNRKRNYYEDGGEYLADQWTHVEVAVDDYYTRWGDHYAYIVTYQNQSGPFVGTWSGNTTDVSYYNGFWDDIYAQNNTAIGLAQFMGSTSYDFVYVRKYLDLSELRQDSVKVGIPFNTSFQFIDDNPGYDDHAEDRLAILQNWGNSVANSDGTWSLLSPQRYEVHITKTDSAVNMEFTHDPNTSPQSDSYTFPRAAISNLTVSAVVDNNQNNDANFSWIIAMPSYHVHSVSASELSNVESHSGEASSEAFAYNVEPLLLCIDEMERVGNSEGNLGYFGVSWGMSFFERLEGSDIHHEDYVKLAHEMQDKLGMSYSNEYYPIGLVTFMVPTKGGIVFDNNLNRLLFNILHVSLDENVSSVDYCFLNYYFPGKLRLISTSRCDSTQYRVYGISDSPERSLVYFFLDEETAEIFLGTKNLLQR